MCLYHKKTTITAYPRIPLEGYIDLTYRCNNNCRHCWLWLPINADERQRELSFDEIGRIASEARCLGCRKWFISGGEPMVRTDFPDIFDFLSHKSTSYMLNSNGTLITPRIARLLKKEGVKYIALYGADAAIHDFITRQPGSFEAMMRGIAYLKEAGASFHVQVIPMKGNFHQYQRMLRLAESLSPFWRVGASWLYLSASGETKKNNEIKKQRLSPRQVLEIDGHDLSSISWFNEDSQNKSRQQNREDRIFAECVSNQQEFHVDPYGQMTFCGFIKDPSLRYDLRKGNFREAWERFIPSLTERRIDGQEEFRENCGSCELKEDCDRCPALSYLEQQSYSGKIDYLCAIAAENHVQKKRWLESHRRYFQLAGFTIRVDSDIPFAEGTFGPALNKFATDAPGTELLRVRHHFSMPKIDESGLGKEVYHISPWRIFRKNGSYVYTSVPPLLSVEQSPLIVVLNDSHSRAVTYQQNDQAFRKGGANSLMQVSSDQIILAHALAYRQACYIHSCGILYQDKGLLFVGHSEAGKSTMAKMFKARGGEILCDDRVVVRKWPDGYRIHGTWSHGEIEEVSPKSAPLSGLFFLDKAEDNHLHRMKDRRQIAMGLLGCLIKPMTNVTWWDKILEIVQGIARDVPCYNLFFDRSGEVVNLLAKER